MSWLPMRSLRSSRECSPAIAGRIGVHRPEQRIIPVGRTNSYQSGRPQRARCPRGSGGSTQGLRKLRPTAGAWTLHWTMLDSVWLRAACIPAVEMTHRGMNRVKSTSLRDSEGCRTNIGPAPFAIVLSSASSLRRRCRTYELKYLGTPRGSCPFPASEAVQGSGCGSARNRRQATTSWDVRTR